MAAEKKSVVFGQGGGRDLKGDVYLPESASETQTLVILLHGGGWRGGSPAGMATAAKDYASRGFVALASEYRLLGESPWPAQAEDVKTAVRWAAENAKDLGVLPSRIVLQGYSAGSHTALVAAADLIEEGGPRAAAVVAYFPQVEISTAERAPKGTAAASQLLGQNPDEAVARRASPIHRISPDTAPTFLIYGGADWLAPPIGGLRYAEALMAAGVKTEFKLFFGQHHEFQNQPTFVTRAQDEIELFLKRAVIDPEFYEAEVREKNMFSAGREAMAKRMAAARAGT